MHNGETEEDARMREGQGEERRLMEHETEEGGIIEGQRKRWRRREGNKETKEGQLRGRRKNESKRM